MVVEGSRLVYDALLSGLTPQFVFYTDEWYENQAASPLRELFQENHVPAFLVSDQVMTSCADTETPQGILAVIPFPHLLPVKELSFVLLIDQIRNPGNMGSILRTAAAAGTDLVILVPGNVDPFNPKVLRGGMGAHFRLPILELEWDEVEQRLQGLDVWVAAAGDGIYYDRVDLVRPVALIIGNEAVGVGDWAGELATGRIMIPMAGGVESLNASVAAGILLLEVVRQRSDTG
ncbi:MAG: RNA methyltransferase [Anaerolineales bacterium]|nr:RNA methyltransferase [Anaerolineales bacterium]